MSVALSVNLNKIALVRNSREGATPDPCEFARVALDAGAHGITVHPRPDERHIRASDVVALSEVCKEYGAEFNIEGNPLSPTQEYYDYNNFMQLVEQVRPQQCTLVPDSSEQLTSDHGFEPSKDNLKRLQPIVKQLREWGCRVSIFADPDPAMVDFGLSVGAQRLELYTGPYAHNPQTLPRYVEVAKLAGEKGLELNAGHDLNLENLPEFVKNVQGLREVSIGHALIADALRVGMKPAVQAYLGAL